MIEMYNAPEEKMAELPSMVLNSGIFELSTLLTLAFSSRVPLLLKPEASKQDVVSFLGALEKMDIVADVVSREMLALLVIAPTSICADINLSDLLTKLYHAGFLDEHELEGEWSEQDDLSFLILTPGESISTATDYDKALIQKEYHVIFDQMPI